MHLKTKLFTSILFFIYILVLMTVKSGKISQFYRNLPIANFNSFA